MGGGENPRLSQAGGADHWRRWYLKLEKSDEFNHRRENNTTVFVWLMSEQIDKQTCDGK